ncbi:lysophospholipid acyltransferase family protein [Bacillus sp. DJP31]|uniref:lysophospholipid acyltransferase family protein n=1 Tax=Bacillus sp. DJP31 TaxID=3409789 RepID=UPI003BB60109
MDVNLYKAGKAICTGLLKPLYQLQVVGADNIPTSGGVIICSNHIDNLDPPIVGISSTRDIHFMAKDELFRLPILKNLLPSINAFPVKRGVSDKQSLRTALQILKDGKVLGLFPEGTRSKTGELGKGLAGAGFFALRTEAQVIPCAIIGPYKPFKRVVVVFGPPINMQEMRERKGSAEEATELIMDSIQQILQKYK